MRILYTLLFILTTASAMHAQESLKPMNSKVTAVSFRLKPHDDLKIVLDEYAKKHKIKAAFVFTCVGSLEQAAIRYANQSNTDTLTGHFEIVSLTGTLAESGSHLHLSISDSTGRTIGGHLKEGSLVYTTAEIVLGILPDLVFDKEVDNTYGYKELLIRKKD
ncbi:MAG: hypothetical protein K0S09_2307 [Sphingobacteriaceae bacterium]|jgi:predicted DNA-binding protein with PD1-like motif|nr:hypothetical protein [Sphingobacteriaceae bacterium]